MTQTADHDYMRRAIALARARLGTTWPNPTVGCVIVQDGTVVAEAATGPGGPDSASQRLHAEEQALLSAGEAARGATAFVTLEPCAARSSGRMSCADRLIAAGSARVVVACPDPSPLAAGAGIARLRVASMRVDDGLLLDEAAPLYAGYRRRLATGRPLVEAADAGFGFDAAFVLEPGESPAQVLERYGRRGYNHLWVERGGTTESILKTWDLLD